MKVISQDEETFTIRKAKRIYTKEVYSPDTGRYFGCNVMGITKKLFREPEHVILGFFDTKEDAEQIKYEMALLMKWGAKEYSVPEGALDLEDLDLYQVEDD